MYFLACISWEYELLISSGDFILKYLSSLMCLKDFEESEIKKEKSSEKMEKTIDCPLCLEPLELDDKKFFPCKCGYQVCRFCWHRIRTNENEQCPACRRIYPENPANFQPLSQEELQKLKHQKKMKDLQRKQKIAENRKQLANIRVIQKNLVFAVGLPLELSQDNQKKEKVLQMFKQFGATHKEAITDRTSYAGSQGPSACVYITYQKAEDAVRAVKALANTKMDGRIIKVSLGTTKYCSNFLKSVHCPKAECLYLHEIADEEASFTKEDIHLGKHLVYEQRLLEETLSALQNKAHSPSNETNRTNYNRNADNSSESSDDLPQNSSFYDSSEASELSPSSNSQNLENNRSIDSDLNLETENNHQNLHSANSESRNNSDTSSNPVFRSDQNIHSNHSPNSNFQDLSLNSVNHGFSNQMQPKDTEPLQQPNFLQMYECTIQSRGQSSSSLNESNILRLISSENSDTTNSFPTISNMRQEHVELQCKQKEDYPDLGFDPCQHSLNALQDMLITEEKEKARIHCNPLNRSSLNNRSPTLPVQLSDGGSRNPFSQPMKVRDPPPGFNNYPQNIYYRPPHETANAVLNKAPVAMHNQLGNRVANYPMQRYPQPGVSLNNSSFVDFSSQQLPRYEVPDLNLPLLQQHNQRYMNVPQAQFPVTEQRPSPLWNNVTQSQWKPENAFFNQSISDSRASNDYNLRLQQMRHNEAAYRQWQQVNGGANNLSPLTPDLPQQMTQDQLTKMQAMVKAFEVQRSSGIGALETQRNSCIGAFETQRSMGALETQRSIGAALETQRSIGAALETQRNSVIGTFDAQRHAGIGSFEAQRNAAIGSLGHRLQYTKKL